MKERATADDGATVIDLTRVFRLFVRNIVVILAISVICGLLGFIAATFLVSAKYSASARMIVNNASDTSQFSGTITNSDLSASTSLTETYAVILKSHDLLERVISDLGLEYDYEEILKMTSVSAVDDTQVMEITVTSTSAEEALDIVSDIVTLAPDMIADTVDVGSVRTVDSPYTTGEKVSPSRSRYTIVGFVCAFIVCILVLVIKELANDKFRSEEDIEAYFGLPVLSVIPLEEEVGAAEKKSNKRRSG